MSGVAVAAGRDLGGVKWINRAYSNDDRAWRLSEARYAGDLSEPALIQDLDPKSLPRWLECHPSWSGECSLGRQLVRSGQQLGLVLPSVVVHQEPFRLDQRLA